MRRDHTSTPPNPNTAMSAKVVKSADREGGLGCGIMGLCNLAAGRHQSNCGVKAYERVGASPSAYFEDSQFHLIFSGPAQAGYGDKRPSQ
jgi:F0F1-type ATP synthase membrane subunit c/vacuolar-type H+-ATPase subunit K